MKFKNFLAVLPFLLFGCNEIQISSSQSDASPFNLELTHDTYIAKACYGENSYITVLDQYEDFLFGNRELYTYKDGKYIKVPFLLPGDKVTIYYKDKSKSEVAFSLVDYVQYLPVEWGPVPGSDEPVWFFTTIPYRSPKDLNGINYLIIDDRIIETKHRMMWEPLYARYREEEKLPNTDYHFYGVTTFDPSERELIKR